MLKTYLLSSFMLSLTLIAQESVVELDPKECMKLRYGNGLGGVIHAQQRAIYQEKKRVLSKLSYSLEEAKKMIQKRYPALNIKSIVFHFQGCSYYFIAKRGKKIYYFDTNLKLIKEKR